MRRFGRDQDPKVQRLAELSLFADCDQRELSEIARILDEVDVPAGRVLMEEGRPAWEVLIVSRGCANVDVGGRQVGTVEGETVLGEMALLGDRMRSATVTASEDMHLFVTDTRGFRELMRHGPVAKRIDELNRQRSAPPDAGS